MKLFKPHQSLEHIKPYLPKNPTIIEAGAFNGSDSIKMTRYWPKATIYAFEPVPYLFEKLVANTALYPQIKCFSYALSDSNGTATLYVSEKPEKPGIPSQASSLRKPKERLRYSSMQFPHEIKVKTITLDSWAQQYDVHSIDLLWLDLQGHELSVLQGATTILSTVSAVFCEVGFIEGYEGQPRYETVKHWLEQKGFTEVGRDFENQESWFFGNILMVRT